MLLFAKYNFLDEQKMQRLQFHSNKTSAKHFLIFPNIYLNSTKNVFMFIENSTLKTQLTQNVQNNDIVLIHLVKCMPDCITVKICYT